MKTLLKSFISLMVLVLVLVSCEENALDPLTGKYTPPEELDFTVLGTHERVKDGSLYVFSINLQDEGANTLNLKLVDVDYILSASDYTASTEISKKTYLIGSEGSTCNGQQITSGTITITLDESTYSMSGIIYLADGTVVKMTSVFTIAYEPDPYVPTYTYTVETETPAMGGSQGDVEITGTTKHKITLNADDEFYAYFEIVADENASSLSGTYTVKDGLDAAGQIANGYYLDWSWWGGAGVMEGGSYYMQGGEKMFIREGAGAVNIVDDGGTLTITAEDLGILDLETLISSGGNTWQNMEEGGTLNIQEATEESGEVEIYTYVTTITSPATYGYGTEIPGSQLNLIKVVNASNDTVAVFEFITDEGATDLSGSYNVVDGSQTAVVIGDANNGAYIDWSWWAMGDAITHSGCYYVENAENKYIRTGSVINVVDNDGVLTITGSDLALLDVEALISSNGATWQNLAETGSVYFSDITPVGEVNNGITLSNVFSATATDNTQYGGTGYNITLKIATEGLTATYNAATYGYDYTGDGNFISLDFHRDDATLVAGTYNVVDYQSETIGDCIAGYEDPYFGSGANWGSVWGTVASDVASDVRINSGTVVVDVNGETYTITVDVATDDENVKATYIGAITIQ